MLCLRVLHIFNILLKLLFVFRFRVSNKYRVLHHHGWVNNSLKKKPTKRYYVFKEKDYGDGNIEVHIEENCLSENKMLLKIPKKINEKEAEEVELNSTKCENNLTLLTAEYNKQLSEHPHDIDLWIKFVKHQVCLFYINILFLKIHLINFIILYVLTGSCILFKQCLWL